MEAEVLIQNEILFGNLLLEMIPHPNGFLGNLLNILTIICHYLAGITTFVVMIPFIYFFYNSRFGIKMAVAVLSTGILNGFEKYIFSSPRPVDLSSQFNEIGSIIKESSFGFPSGHSHISILIWGMIYIRFKNIYIRVVSLFFIIFTPFSRMYAGVHYPGDVIGGFFSGLISLIIIEWFFSRYPSFPSPNDWARAKSSVKSSSLAVIAFTLSFLLLDDTSTNEKNTLVQIISASGSMAGLYIGLVRWKLNYSNYDIEDCKFIRTFLLLGLTIIALYVGLGRLSELFIKDSLIFRYIRYFTLNYSIIYIVPYLSLVILGEKENPV